MSNTRFATQLCDRQVLDFDESKFGDKTHLFYDRLNTALIPAIPDRYFPYQLIANTWRSLEFTRCDR